MMKSKVTSVFAALCVCWLVTDCSHSFDAKTGTVRLKLRNSGPGVMDSNFTFDASLFHTNGTVFDKRLHVYEWKDDAFEYDKKTTENYTKSQIQKVYHSDVSKYKPGTYKMNVTVYKKAARGNKKHGEKVADGSMEFVLTEQLNVLLHLHQNTSGKRKLGFFATGVPIILTANITDNINLVNTSYSWHVDNSSTEAVTSEPHYEFTFEKVQKVKWQYLGVTADGNCTVQNPDTKKIQEVKKTGLWKDFIHLADRVSNITYNGNLTYLEGDLLTANVSCEGSAPFYICANISIGALHPDNCSDFARVDTCEAPLKMNLTEYGNYTVVIVVQNDVSQQSLSVKLNVKRPELPLAGSTLVVLACIAISMIVITLVAYSYTKQNRNTVRKMETADFHFHPFQSGSSRNSTFSVERIKQSLSSLFTSNRDSSESDRSYRALQVKSYGAISSEEEML